MHSPKVFIAEQVFFMAEAPVAIPPDVFEAVCPAAAATPEAPIAGNNPAPPAKEVS